jgi:glycosyltransferase involved in cell wall biosynthesis
VSAIDTLAHEHCRAMRILHVIPSLAVRHGGPPKAVTELCLELARRGEEVAIYTTNIDGRGRLQVPFDRPLRLAEHLEVRYFRVVLPGLFGFSPDFARTLRDTIKDYDIVHVHSLYRFTSTVAARYARQAGLPYIVRPHGTLDPFIFGRHRRMKWIYEALFERRNLEAASAVHFTADEEMRLAQLSGITFHGVVVPLGVNANPCRGERNAGDLNRRWPQTRGRKTILYLGRLNFKKGLDILVRAFGKVARSRDDVHLLIAGPDDEGYGRRVAQWLSTEGVLHKTTFAGMLVGREKMMVLQGADVFVLSSYSENFGMAVVEAMAAGLPVIISNRVNIWREVAQSKAGLVVDCCPEQLAAALSSLLDNSTLRADLSCAGRALAAERFTWAAAGQQMIDVYREIVASNAC